jgi:hypothetical protein
VSGPVTLAELFAMTSGIAPVRPGQELGFHLPTPLERRFDRRHAREPTQRTTGWTDRVQDIPGDDERLADSAECASVADAWTVPGSRGGRRRLPSVWRP